MNRTSLIESARAELPARPLARWASILFSLSVLTLVISLAASQAFLSGAGLLYAADLLRHPDRPHFPKVKLPLALFCLTTLISIGWAENPTIGWLAVRKLVLFLILLLAVNLVVSAKHLTVLYQGLFLTSGLAAVAGARQFLAQYRDVRAEHPGRIYYYMTLTRITGFMGHWMNFGGQQMLASVCLLAFVLLGIRSWRFAVSETGGGGTEGRIPPPASRVPWIWWLVLLTIALSVFLNFSRGVWLGCLIAVVYLVAQWQRKWLLLLPALLVAGFLAAPSLVRERLEMAFHPSHDPALSMRFEVWQAGLNMIRRHPLVGVGPDNIPEVYTLYLPKGVQPELGFHDHMHNDFLQFAAERGLPCLVAWLWLMAALAWHFWRIRRRLRLAGRSTWVADAALASWLAFLAEGFFEYNFGTSPVLMVFLFVASTPFVVGKDPELKR